MINFFCFYIEFYLISDDVEFIKAFNNFGINALTIRSNMEFYINKIVNSVYWKIGIFLDIRCQNPKEVSEILKKVRVILIIIVFFVLSKKSI